MDSISHYLVLCLERLGCVAQHICIREQTHCRDYKVTADEQQKPTYVDLKEADRIKPECQTDKRGVAYIQISSYGITSFLSIATALAFRGLI